MKPITTGTLGVFIFLIFSYQNLIGQCPEFYLESNLINDYKTSGQNFSISVITDGSAPVTNYVLTPPAGQGPPISQSGSSFTNLTATGTYSVHVIGSNCTTAVHTIDILDGTAPTGAFYTPDYYWTFEAPNTPLGMIGGTNYTSTDMYTSINQPAEITRFPIGDKNYSSFSGGQVGDFISIDLLDGAKPNGVIVKPNHQDVSALTFQFLVRLDEDAETIHFQRSGHGGAPAVRLLITSTAISIDLFYGPNYSKFRHLAFDLNGVDRKNWNYYSDGEWHHIAVTSDLQRGLHKLFVDGISPDEFQFFVMPEFGDVFEGRTGTTDWVIRPENSHGKYELGDFDEYAITLGQALPAAVIYQNYLDAINIGKHYSFEDNIAHTAIPNGPDLTGFLDENEFPIGYVTSAKASAIGLPHPIDQINDAPKPRYLPGNTLLRNYPFVSYVKFGGQLTYASTTQSQVNGIELNEELSKNWNYYSQISAQYFGSNFPMLGLDDFANSNVDIPVGLTVYANQTSLDKVNGSPTKWGRISQSTLADHFYMRNSPTTLSSVFHPLEFQRMARNFGMSAARSLEDGRLSPLKRPIDQITDNGEVRPNATEWSNLMGFNSDVSAHCASATGGNNNACYSQMKTDLRRAYRDEFMNNSYFQSAGTRYSYYSIDGQGGHSAWNVDDWEELKQINFSENGNVHSTPDFYPLRPGFWHRNQPGNNSFSWIENARQTELSFGDNLFSPFVCAGWRMDPTPNIRPGQFLGLLKLLNNYGAEFFYSSYFVDQDMGGSPQPNQDPRHWTWQFLMPSYAQAIASRYEYILRDGVLLTDQHLTYPDGNPHHRIKGGSNVYNLVRKWENPGNSADVHYVISTAHMPISNYQEPGGSSYDKIVTMEDMDGLNVSLETRKQGSVYLFRYDPQSFTEPVFIQLDSWHEDIHPTRWSDDLVFEAELADELMGNSTNTLDPTFLDIRTRIPDNSDPGNVFGLPVNPNGNMTFTDYTTFTTFSNHQFNMSLSNWNYTQQGPSLAYNFHVTPDNGAGADDFLFAVRARVKEGHEFDQSSIFIKVISTDKNEVIYSDEIVCISGYAWMWYTQGVCDLAEMSLPEGNYRIELQPGSEMVDIDQFMLDRNGDFVFPAAEIPAPCTKDMTLADFVPDFEIVSTCTGDVEFVNTSGGLVGYPCLIDVKYNWEFAGETTGPGYANSMINNNQFYEGTFSNPKYKVQVAAGSYSVTLWAIVTIDLSGIQTTHTYSQIKNITVLDRPVIQSITPTTNVCIGDETTLTVSATGNGNLNYSWWPSLTTHQSNSATTTVEPMTAGQETYSVTVTDANGCEAQDEVLVITGANVSNWSIYINGVQANSAVSCNGNAQAKTIEVVGAPGTATFEWYPEDQLTCSPCTTSQVTTLTESSIYRVRVTEQNGCSAVDYVAYEVFPGSPCKTSPSGEEEVLNDSENIQLYPNPNNGQFQLRLFGEYAGQSFGVEVMDYSGKTLQIFEERIFDEMQINLLEEPSGIYFVRVFNQEVNEVISVIKQY
ncbi:T9SS type A sorting domain-containing protein [bacterium SCSIO 12741]|nr:T9SS type A sorting domain-containing protein [bacterium SCSIO 12741]